MVRAHEGSRRGRTGGARFLAAGALLLAVVLPAACEPAPDAAFHRDTVPGVRARPLDTDPDVAERVGHAALAKLGYEKIMRLALEAHWIRYPAPQSENALGQASAFWPVFTRWAVTAGVVSQVDSPAPGPADVVALGILVIGLIDAGLVAAHVVSAAEDVPITGPTAAPPVPVAKPTSTPAPTVIPTAIPTAMPGDWSEYPECNLQYDQDTAYCNRFRKAEARAACRAIASERFAYCKKAGGKTGFPERYKINYD